MGQSLHIYILDALKRLLVPVHNYFTETPDGKLSSLAEGGHESENKDDPCSNRVSEGPTHLITTLRLADPSVKVLQERFWGRFKNQLIQTL